jgi:hypothetical protein
MFSYIAVHKDNGIYLGVVAGYALFSVTDIPVSSKAIRFASEEEVLTFFEKSLPKLSDGITAIKIETNAKGNYVDVVDILKSGYYNHTDSMVDALPVENETIH